MNRKEAMRNKATGAELEYQNATVDRFARALREFQAREKIDYAEFNNIVLSHAAKVLGHWVQNDEALVALMALFTDRAREEFEDHKRECIGKGIKH